MRHPSEARHLRLLQVAACALIAQLTSSCTHPDDPLTTCGEVLSAARHGVLEGRRVHLKGSVVYSDTEWSLLFVTDSTGTVLVLPAQGHTLPATGRLVSLEGTTMHNPGEALVTDARITDIGTAPLPVAQTQPRSGRPDWIDRWGDVTGVVRRVTQGDERVYLDLVALGQSFRSVVVIPGPTLPSDESYLGSTVTVRGVLAAETTPSQSTLGGLPLWCPSRSEIRVERVALPRDVTPIRPIADINRLATAPPDDRIRIRGLVAERIAPDASLVRDETGIIRLRHTLPIAPNDDVDVVGFVAPTPEGLEITDSDVWVRETPFGRPAAAAGKPVVTTVAALRSLTRQEALEGLPVRLEATVTWRHPVHGGEYFVLQDGEGAYVVPRTGFLPLVPGDLVRVEGFTHPGSLAPIVVGAALTRIRFVGPPPHPLVKTETRVAGRFDCQPAQIEGFIREIRPARGNDLSTLLLYASGQRVPVLLPPASREDLQPLLDAKVRVRGVIGTLFDWTGHLAGFRIHVSRLADVTVLERGVADPFSLPITAVADLFRTGAAQPWGHRLRIRGTVLLHRPGTLFLRDDTGSVVVRSPLLLPTRPGDVLDVVGFPVPDPFAPALDDASFRIDSRSAPPLPIDVSPLDLLSGRHNADLVRVEGSLLNVIRTSSRVTLLISVRDTILSAVLDSESPGPLVEALDPGCLLRVTGVVGPTPTERLALRSTADINILASPPFWNPTRAKNTLVVFFILVSAAFVWALTLRKRVRAQTHTIEERLTERNALIHELELRNAELERFTYTVSHDLKTPLVTIGGFLGLVEQDALAGNPQRLRADIKRIAEATDKMRRLLDELLQLSRAGRRLSTVEVLPLHAIVEEALSLVDTRSRDAHVHVHPRLPDVIGDRGRLVEVFQNLLENAVKYSGNHPSPTIEIGSSGIDEHGRATIFVKDNGIGIPEEFHSRIFELFEKLDPASQGTGVGLALVRRIVDAHGGHVCVQSEGPGTGTTFILSLPAGGRCA